MADTNTVVRICSNRYSTTSQRSMIEYRRNSTLSDLAGFQFRSFGLRMDSETEHAFGEIVSGEYFTMLGVTAARGRLFGPDDDRSDAPPVAVLSHSFWTRRFGASSAALGLVLAFGVTRFLAALLFGVSPTDPWVFTGVILLLALVAFTTALVPALRASRLDPIAALRNS